MFQENQDIRRKKFAISSYVDLKGGTFKKLGANDVDYKLFDDKGNITSYIEVKVLETTIAHSFPLTLSARKLLKLIDKRLNPVVLWSCGDGIIYGKPYEISGELVWSTKLDDLEVKYNNKKQFRYVRF